MRKILFICLFLLLVISSCKLEERVLDFDTFENLEVGILSTKRDYGEKIYIKSNEQSFEINMPDMNPWRVEFCNIDGGEIEIAIGVYKKSPHHNIMAKRIFFYNIGEGKIIPKYRMSRLTYPFIDYIIYDVDSDGLDEIIAIEEMKNGDYSFGGYNWVNFSFERSYSSENIKGDVRFSSEPMAVVIDGEERMLYLKDNELRWK